MQLSSYNDKINKKQLAQIKKILDMLPSYMADFVRGIEPTTSINTRLEYMYDLRLFFEYKFDDLKDVSLEMLGDVTTRELEEFLEYLSYYEKVDNDGNVHTIKNSNKGKARKLASLKTMYKYFYKHQLIQKNPTLLIDIPKITHKNIVKLEIEEIVMLLDEVESGNKLTERQKKYHEYTKQRDLALISLMLGTGIRVSECVGLNIEDVDFNYNGIKITRKGGDESIVYFGDEVETALLEYINIRKTLVCKDDDTPLFLSLQLKRLSVRSVQNVVKKYSSLVTSLKTITPHKLRSTYGTQLYNETGDIYLVADVLGHKDVNTTKKHYAHMDDNRRRAAAKMVKLRSLE
ncbi:MAG: integrase [Epulopiscium sp. Nele67-Bin004]|nr:MAG: integrase [Epulopiscium sp. Nele67-Bin004]